MTSTYARKRFKPHRTRVNEVELANLLNREFGNYTPHTHLASDLMYMRVGGGGWSYVCLPVSLANRGIADHGAGRGLAPSALATPDPS